MGEHLPPWAGDERKTLSGGDIGAGLCLFARFRSTLPW